MLISKYVLTFLKKYDRSDDQRGTLVRKNIFFSFLIKGLSILISLLLVPLTLHYLSTYEYGIWITLSSVFIWINYFDIGLGNGLRNRLTESIAKKDEELGQIYVSTAFFILLLITVVVFLLFLFIQPFLNWSEILNVDSKKIGNLNEVILFSFGFFCMSFLFKVTGIVYTSYQKPAFNDLIAMAGNLLSLILLIVLVKTTEGSVLKAAVTFSAAPVVVLLIAYFISFYGPLRKLRPRMSMVKLCYARDLLNLGVQFFILQISGLFIFGTSNLIISRILGPGQVTPYNIAFRYFGAATMIFGIIITPVWSASTDAFSKGDLAWIKNYMKVILKIMALISLGILVLLVVSDFAYRLWIGENVSIPWYLSLGMGIYTLIVIWSTCYSTFLFGFGKLRIQLINTFIASVLFIPIASWLGKYWGVTGIVTALCLVNLSGAVLNPLQYYRIVNGKARGIWNK